jgi:autotransporter-associated beta strand protein
LDLTSNGTTGMFSQNAKITATSTTINLTAGSYWQIGSATPGNDAFGGNTNTVNVANGAQMKIAWNAESYNNNWTFSGGTGLSSTSYSLRIDQAKLLGTITLNSGDTVFSAFNRTNSELRGQITGSGALTFGMKDTTTGAGATTVYNTANDWTGGLTIQSNNNSTTLNLGASGVLTDTGSVTFNNVSTTNRSILDMKGFNETVDLLVSSGSSASSATGIVTNSGATQSTLTLGGGSASSATFTGVIQDGTSSIALTKSGSGTQILSGANTYTGGTTISAGTLQAANTAALGAGAVTVSGGTLSLNGASVQAVSGITDLSLTSGTIAFTLTSAVSFDSISGTGSFTLSGGTIDLTNSVTDYASTYQILNFTSGGAVSGITISNYDTTSYTASLSNTGVLSFTAVPEPSEYALAIVGLLGVMIFVRRRVARFGE